MINVVDVVLCGSVLCTYELSEASHRQPTGSRYKLKQTDSLLVVHLFHHLQGHNSIIHFTADMCVCSDQGLWLVYAQ